MKRILILVVALFAMPVQADNTNEIYTLPDNVPRLTIADCDKFVGAKAYKDWINERVNEMRSVKNFGCPTNDKDRICDPVIMANKFDKMYAHFGIAFACYMSLRDAILRLQ